MSCPVGESAYVVPQVTPVNLCLCVVYGSVLQLEGKTKVSLCHMTDNPTPRLT